MFSDIQSIAEILPNITFMTGRYHRSTFPDIVTRDIIIRSISFVNIERRIQFFPRIPQAAVRISFPYFTIPCGENHKERSHCSFIILSIHCSKERSTSRERLGVPWTSRGWLLAYITAALRGSRRQFAIFKIESFVSAREAISPGDDAEKCNNSYRISAVWTYTSVLALPTRLAT